MANHDRFVNITVTITGFLGAIASIVALVFELNPVIITIIICSTIFIFIIAVIYNSQKNIVNRENSKFSRDITQMVTNSEMSSKNQRGEIKDFIKEYKDEYQCIKNDVHKLSDNMDDALRAIDQVADLCRHDATDIQTVANNLKESGIIGFRSEGIEVNRIREQIEEAGTHIRIFAVSGQSVLEHYREQLVEGPSKKSRNQCDIS